MSCPRWLHQSLVLHFFFFYKPQCWPIDNSQDTGSLLVISCHHRGVFLHHQIKKMEQCEAAFDPHCPSLTCIFFSHIPVILSEHFCLLDDFKIRLATLPTFSTSNIKHLLRHIFHKLIIKRFAFMSFIKLSCHFRSDLRLFHFRYDKSSIFYLIYNGI